MQDSGPSGAQQRDPDLGVLSSFNLNVLKFNANVSKYFLDRCSFTLVGLVLLMSCRI